MTILGPKDIAARLGISERGATRLMRQGDIPSFRAGAKPWRTTELHLESYIGRQMEVERKGYTLPATPSLGLSITTPGVPRSQVASNGLSVTNRDLPPGVRIIGQFRRR